MPEYNRDYWEGMYEMPLDELPWEIKEAPIELREYVESNKVPDGKALDAGCGTGNFSIFLAQNGFSVVGVDYSEKAIDIARKNAEKYALPLRFVRSDLTDIAETLPNEQFDLILDYKVAHHMPIHKLHVYIEQCRQLLKSGGRLLLICYSDKDIDATGHGSATGKFGNEMFYRSADEVRKIYQGFQELSYKEVMLGKHLNHAGHCFVFERR